MAVGVLLLLSCGGFLLVGRTSASSYEPVVIQPESKLVTAALVCSNRQANLSSTKKE